MEEADLLAEPGQAPPRGPGQLVELVRQVALPMLQPIGGPGQIVGLPLSNPGPDRAAVLGPTSMILRRSCRPRTILTIQLDRNLLEILVKDPGAEEVLLHAHHAHVVK